MDLTNFSESMWSTRFNSDITYWICIKFGIGGCKLKLDWNYSG
jgi:hypothetical protein